MKRTTEVSAAVLAFVLAFGVVCEVWAAISISGTGAWTQTIGANDLTGGAGTNLNSSYESAADAYSITISGTTGPSDTWRVDVKKVDGTWNPNLLLSVKRTSSGSGGSVSGGQAYQQLGNTYAAFFSGSDDVSGISVQLKLTGVSITIPPGTYTNTVYYTVVDN